MHVRDGRDADAFSLAQAEDIINRGGGNLIIELWNTGAHEETENTDVTVTIDGCRQTHAPGSQLRLTPGKHLSHARSVSQLLGRTRLWRRAGGRSVVGE